ncbi:MAG: hypothetical protein MO852_16710, partial [Candidatus Devosia euplotis]|nr:hypothetical protein [Candidatus Devosia euplotis]
MYETAFGPWSADSSIGTHQLVLGGELLGYDQEPFGELLSGGSAAKNHFFEIPDHPETADGQSVLGGPNLRWALFVSEGGWLPMLAIASATPSSQVPNTWAWHREMYETLSYEGRPQVGGILVNPGQDPNPGQNLQIAIPADDPDPDELATLLGTVDDEPGAPRRMLGAELDELYRLQQRFKRLERRWADLDVQYEGSGWTLAQLQPPEPNIDDFVLAPLPGAGGTGNGLNLDLDLVAPAPPTETELRQAVLSEMLTVLWTAGEAGCFAEGVTPCDWSFLKFAHAVGRTFRNAQEKLHEECVEFTAGLPFYTIPQADPPLGWYQQAPPNLDIEDLDCRPEPGVPFTAKAFERWQEDIEGCEATALQWYEDLEVAKKKAALMATPLYDAATDSFAMPGVEYA